MRFEALGPVRVLIDDGPIELRPAQRRLLASLLLDHGSWVTTDTLVDRMWGDAVPNTARSSLHVHLSAVRRQVPGVVNTGQGRYILDLDGHQLDVSDFGPTLAVRELAANKVLALFDRAEARDFLDLAELTRRFELQGSRRLTRSRRSPGATPKQECAPLMSPSLIPGCGA